MKTYEKDGVTWREPETREDIENLKGKLDPGDRTLYLYTGYTDDVSSNDAAHQAAEADGNGVTLNQLLEENNISMPEDNSPNTNLLWDDASKAAVENASGDVVAYVGTDNKANEEGSDKWRGNTYDNTEREAALQNDKIKNLTEKDPKTGVEVDVKKDGEATGKFLNKGQEVDYEDVPHQIHTLEGSQGTTREQANNIRSVDSGKQTVAPSLAQQRNSINTEHEQKNQTTDIDNGQNQTQSSGFEME